MYTKKKKPKKMQSPAVEHDRFLGYLLMYTKGYAGDTMLEHLASFATTFCKTCTLFVFKNIFCGNFNFFVIYATVTISYEKRHCGFRCAPNTPLEVFPPNHKRVVMQ